MGRVWAFSSAGSPHPPLQKGSLCGGVSLRPSPRAGHREAFPSLGLSVLDTSERGRHTRGSCVGRPLLSMLLYRLIHRPGSQMSPRHVAGPHLASAGGGCYEPGASLRPGPALLPWWAERDGGAQPAAPVWLLPSHPQPCVWAALWVLTMGPLLSLELGVHSSGQVSSASAWPTPWDGVL